MAGGVLTGGRVLEPIISHLDLYPTLMELLDVEPPAWLEGASLLPLLSGEVKRVHEAVFTEQTYHGSLEPLRAVRTEQYKLVRHHFSTGNQMRHDGPITSGMAGIGWYDRETGTEELFDLFLDPGEACNRIDDPEYSEIGADLRGRLDQWMNDTNDCFPSGKFPDIPSGNSDHGGM